MTCIQLMRCDIPSSQFFHSPTGTCLHILLLLLFSRAIMHAKDSTTAEPTKLTIYKIYYCNCIMATNKFYFMYTKQLALLVILVWRGIIISSTSHYSICNISVHEHSAVYLERAFTCALQAGNNTRLGKLKEQWRRQVRCPRRSPCSLPAYAWRSVSEH